MQNILIVEDHDDAMIRMKQIVSEAFENPTVATATTLEMGRQHLKKQFFDLAILDLALPDGNGETLALEISTQFPNTYVVISTIHDESERLLSALQNGARGFLLKEQPKDHLIQEFKGILKGKPPLAPTVTRRLMEMVKVRGEEAPKAFNTSPQTANLDKYSLKLTKREAEVLRMIAKGLDRTEIGNLLGISQNTVSSHISKLYSKAKIRNRAEATRLAHALGLI